MKKRIRLSLLALFLTSCVTEVNVVPSATNVDPAISTEFANTISGNLLVTPTSTIIPIPIPTSTITLTPDPIYLTEESIISSCAATERSWYTKHISTTYFTNGKWNAVICTDNGIYTKVWSESLELEWTLPAEGDEFSGNEPAWYWMPYLWSDDGKYLYLEPVCLCSIDSPWLIYSSGYGLSRLDLNKGVLEVWLKPYHTGYSFEFTQDGRVLAFSLPDLSDEIKIRNLTTGDEQRLAFKEKYVILEYRWSADNSRLIIFTEEHEANPVESGFSIFVYSVGTETLRKLIDRDNLSESFPTEDYIEPRIVISDLTGDLLTLSHIFGEVEYQLNIETGELTKLDN